MAEIKWIKICTDLFDDEKILLIDGMEDRDSIIVIWVKLLCLAGKQNNNGVFMIGGKMPYTDEMLATIFHRPLETVQKAMTVFETFGMVEVVEGVFTLPNWEKHQSLEQFEKNKEKTRKRVAEHRARQKEKIDGNVTVTPDVTQCNNDGNVTVTQCNGDRIDKNRLDKKRIEVVEVSKKHNLHSNGDGDATAAEIYQSFESEFGRPLTPTELDKIAGWLADEKLNANLILHCLKTAVLRNKRSLQYIDSVLQSWADEGLHTVDEVEERNRVYREQQSVKPKKENYRIFRGEQASDDINDEDIYEVF